MFISKKNKRAVISLLLALTLTACTAEEPVNVQSEPAQTKVTSAENTATASETVIEPPTTEEAASETSKTEETATAPKSEETTMPPETSPKETEAPIEITPVTTPETTTAETLPQTTAELWTESPASGVMYINTDEVYSRAQAVQGSTKVKMYSLNEAVNVTARTDTEYFKLDDGAFIHASFLSSGKTEITEATTAAATTAAITTTTEATTAEATAEEPAETSNSTLGQYGQRSNTQSELDFIAKTFDLVNKERAKAGIPEYQHLDVLDTIASIRAWELTVAYRSDHIRPDGTTCTTAFQENGIIYGAWSENVAAGQQTPEEVVDAWMNSPPHKAAILNTEYTYMGVGYYYSENDTQNFYHFWTLEFYRY